jgi:hypothetical protein
MRRLTKLLTSILLVTLWLPAQAQQIKTPLPSPCKVQPLPYTPGELQDIFKTYNGKYWSGKLPHTVIVWTALGTRKFGETTQDEGGRFIIRLDSAKNREQIIAKTTILHEMAHVKTWGDTCHVVDKPDDCARWLAEIHRIMAEGAFDDLV